MDEALAKEIESTDTRRRKIDLLQTSIERAASAVANTVLYSIDVDFCTYLHTKLQTTDNHRIHCKTSEALWGTCERLFDVNAFQCTCKHKFKCTEDSCDGVSPNPQEKSSSSPQEKSSSSPQEKSSSSPQEKSSSCPQKKFCSSKSSPYPDFFQQVEDCFDEFHEPNECSLYDDVSDGLPKMNEAHTPSQETEISEQEVPNLHSSCDWFEDVLKEE